MGALASAIGVFWSVVISAIVVLLVIAGIFFTVLNMNSEEHAQTDEDDLSYDGN